MSETKTTNFDPNEKLDLSQIHDMDYLQFKTFITNILKDRAKFSNYNVSQLPFLSQFTLRNYIIK